MQKVAFSLAIATIATLLALTIPAVTQPVTDAPSGFDDSTSIEPVQHPEDKQAFDKVELKTPDGLGPVYNAQACRECHQNPVSGGASQIVEQRAGRTGTHGQFFFPTVPIIGDTIKGRTLINDRAICPQAQEHVPASANIRTNRLSLNLLGDGFIEAVPDSFILARRDAQCFPKGTTNPSGTESVCGVALFVDILEAPGVPNQRLGRFGWKNQHASLLSFAADAYLNEMGITNRLQKDEVTLVCNPRVSDKKSDDTVTEPNDQPEDGLEDIDRFARFMRGTRTPPRLIPSDRADTIRHGEEVFKRTGCELCHAQEMFTATPGTRINGGGFEITAALGNKRFQPFSDFLLHDVGTGDGIAISPIEHYGRAIALNLLERDRTTLEAVPLTQREIAILEESRLAQTRGEQIAAFPLEGAQQSLRAPIAISPFQYADVCNPRILAQIDSPAKQRFYRTVLCTTNHLRTPALWGLHQRSRFMHDGNSVTLEDAIMRHKGEAATVTERFRNLIAKDKADLLEFLGSL